MRILLTVLAMSVPMLLTGCGGEKAASSPTTPESRAQADADARPIAAPTATLTVQGLSCPLCASDVDKQLMKVNGVESVSVDLGGGTVRVAFAGGARPTAAALRKAVEDSGYTLVSIDTP